MLKMSRAQWLRGDDVYLESWPALFSHLVAIRVYNHIDWNEWIEEWEMVGRLDRFKRIVARPIIVANCFR